MTCQSINSYDGKVLFTFEELNDAQLETALSTAAACFDTWRQKTFAERAAVVEAAAALMRAHVDEFARPLTLEHGKLIEQARGEVVLSADILAYYAKNARHFAAAQDGNPTLGESQAEGCRLGVLFGVEPWNFPYYQLTRFVAPNLMAGNVVLVKHPGYVPQCTRIFEQLWRQAGAPAGVFTNLLISHDQVQRVIEDPRINGVALTGNVEAGKIAGRRIKKDRSTPTVDITGNYAIAVPEDAYLNNTIQRAVWSDLPGFYGPRMA